MHRNLGPMINSLPFCKMYFKVFLLAYLVADTYSANSHLKLQALDDRILSGKDALPGQFPYLVSIQSLQKPSNEFVHSCGGAILNERWILTAAHCLPDNGIPLVIRAGKYDLSKKETGEQVARVKKFFKHKLFSKDPASYDIGLMKLRTPLKLNERVAKIALPEKDSEPSGQGTLAGWGYMSVEPGQPLATILQTVTLPIIDRKTCNEAVKKLNPEYRASETNVCTAEAPRDGIGSCGGDSGSPLVTTNDRGETEVVGVLAWIFDPCGSKGAPDAYTRVASFIDWIEDIIHTNKC